MVEVTGDVYDCVRSVKQIYGLLMFVQTGDNHSPHGRIQSLGKCKHPVEPFDTAKLFVAI